MLYWLNICIETDKTLRLFKTHTTIEYQYIIQDNINTTRYYDACFPNIKLLIEVQEDSIHHDKSDNDIDKRCLAIRNGYVIYYIKQSQYKLKHNKYLETLWHEIRNLIIGGICSHHHDISIQHTFVHEWIQEELKLHKDNEITKIARHEQSILEMFTKWYISYRNDKYISLEEIIDIIACKLRIDTPVEVNDIIDGYIDVLEYYKDGNDYFIEYNSVGIIFNRYFENINMRALTFIFNKHKKYSDTINELMRKFNHLLLINDLSEHFLVEPHVQSTYGTMARHRNTIAINENKIDELNKTITEHKNKFDNLIVLKKSCTDFLNTLEGRISSAKKHTILRCGDKFLSDIAKAEAEVEAKRNENDKIGLNQVTIVAEINKSIILEYPTCGIIYTGSSQDKFNVAEVREWCAQNLYDDDVIDAIIERFTVRSLNNMEICGNLNNDLLIGLAYDINGYDTDGM